MSIAARSRILAMVLLAQGLRPLSEGDLLMLVDFEGTQQFNHEAIDKRLQREGVRLRLKEPVSFHTICLVKEIVRDVMGEKGFADAAISHELTPLSDPHRTKLVFHIKEGTRGPRAAAPRGTPEERCRR